MPGKQEPRAPQAEHQRDGRHLGSRRQHDTARGLRPALPGKVLEPFQLCDLDECDDVETPARAHSQRFQRASNVRKLNCRLLARASRAVSGRQADRQMWPLHREQGHARLVVRDRGVVGQPFAQQRSYELALVVVIACRACH